MKIDNVTRECIQVRPETRRELNALMNVLHIEPDSDEYHEKTAKFIQGGNLVFDHHAGARVVADGGGWCRVSGTLDPAWMAPYWNEVKKQLGADPFDVDLTPGLWMGVIRHTGYMEELRQVGSETRFTMTSVIYPRMGCHFDRIPQGTAAIEALRHVVHEVGTMVPCPEYIEVGGGGLYKKNPRWGCGDTQYTPAIGAPHLLLYIGDQWLSRFATPAQKEVVARIHRPDWAGLDWFNNRTHNNSFNLDNCHGQITFQDFQKL